MVWGAMLVGAVGAVPVLTGLWILDRRRAERRNREGRCSGCGTAWTESLSAEPFLIHGRLVCSECADRARRRIPWYVGFVGAAAGFAATASFWQVGTAAAVLMPVGSAGALTLAAVQLMKRANRRAERLIAGGELPELQAAVGSPEGTFAAIGSGRPTG